MIISFLTVQVCLLYFEYLCLTLGGKRSNRTVYPSSVSPDACAESVQIRYSDMRSVSH